MVSARSIAGVSESGLVLGIGAELPHLKRTYNRQRWSWAETAISVGADDEDRSFRPERNIHSDELMASAQGLPGRIATGALLVNWISSLLVQHFGWGYFAEGSLRVKFVSPVIEGDVTTTRIKVEDFTAVELERARCEMSVLLETPEATCVVGEATAFVRVLT